jgi:hypothetical protein
MNSLQCSRHRQSRCRLCSCPHTLAHAASRRMPCWSRVRCADAIYRSVHCVPGTLVLVVLRLHATQSIGARHLLLRCTHAPSAQQPHRAIQNRLPPHDQLSYEFDVSWAMQVCFPPCRCTLRRMRALRALPRPPLGSAGGRLLPTPPHARRAPGCSRQRRPATQPYEAAL